MSKKKKKQNLPEESIEVTNESVEESENELDALLAEEEPETKKEEQPQPQAKRKPRKGLGEELIEVYEATGDDLGSITMLEHKRRTWKRMLVWILLFLLAVFIGVAAVSWFIWGGRQAFTGEQVLFELNAPAELASGSSVELALHYANREDISFRKAEVELRLPPGFIFESAEPQPTSSNNLWDLGTVPSGQEGDILVRGRLVGRPEMGTTISGLFRYWPANFSSEFAEIASAEIKVLPVKAEFRLEAPDQVLVGQKTSLSAILANPTEEPMHNLRIEPIYPENFIIESSNPELDEKGLWIIPEVKANEEREFQIDGYFSSAEMGETELIVLLAQQGRDQDYFQQKEQRQEVRLIQGDLLAQLIVNGASKDSTIQWGETLNGSINFRNNSKTTLGDITAVVTIESRYRSQDAERASAGAVDFSTLVDAARGSVKQLEAVDTKTLHRRSITWTGDDVATLALLEPDEEGELNFQVALLDAQRAIDRLAHPEDVEIVMQVQMIVAKTGDIKEELTVSANPITFKLNTDLVFDAHVRYYADNGEQLGYGPLPPKVGEETVYHVVWRLENSIHEVEHIVASVQLPSGVSWKNVYEVSAGEVKFSASTNELTWTLNRLPVDVPSATLEFELGLRPTASQIGEIASLTKKITMTAKDSVTGGSIIQTALPLTTGVDRDKEASDKGIVVE